MSNNLWEFACISFGILSIIGTTLFVICFNLAVYKRNKRIERKGYYSFENSSKKHQTHNTDEDEPVKKHSKLDTKTKKKKK